MCNYQGYEFGAGRYPDSVCIDGRLFNADSGVAAPDGSGWWYDDPGEDIPCPICRRDAAIEWWTNRNEGLDGVTKNHAAEAARNLVDDIRKNRGVA